MGRDLNSSGPTTEPQVSQSDSRYTGNGGNGGGDGWMGPKTYSSGHQNEINTKNDPYKNPENAVNVDDFIIGMPPATYVSDKMMENTMPTATIIPCEPEFSMGLSLFTLNQEKGRAAYKEILNSVGFNSNSGVVKVAYLADSFPSETFNNEYGETFLDKFAQVASSGLGDLAQIAGWTKFSDAQSQIGDFAKNIPVVGGALSGAASALGDMFSGAKANMSESNQKLMSTMQDTMGSVMAGARVDFPQVWKNSGFSPTYTLTIRIYNPNPADEDMTKKYLVGPIAALVALGVPKVAEDASTYKWPLLCKIRSPGIFHLNAAYISSITVVKGGDHQLIGYNQVMGMCDVRIEFGSLYKSILAGKGSNKFGDRRPTLGTYLETIGGISMTGAEKKRKVNQTNDASGSIDDPPRSNNASKSAPIRNDAAPTDAVSPRTPDDDAAIAENLSWGNNQGDRGI